MVVNGLLGISLPAPSADDRHVGLLIEHATGLFEPVADHFTIAVDELHEAYVRIDTHQPVEPLIAQCAAENGRERSSSTTSTPRPRASSMLPSVEPEST